MVDDKYYKYALDSINQNSVAKNAWQRITSQPIVNLQTLSTRKVHFKVYGMSIPLYYSNEHLKRNKRFQIIEYTPTNKLLQLLSKIL